MRGPAAPGRRRALLAGAALLALPSRPALADQAPSGAPSGALGRILSRQALRAGVVLDSPPWAAPDEMGRPNGSEVAVLRQLALDLGVGLELVPLDADEHLAALERGTVEVLASLAWQPSLLRRVALARPHARRRSVVAGRAGHALRGFDDLSGHEVALPIGSELAEAIHPHLPPDAVAVFLPDQAECLAALLAGEVQGAAAHEWNVQELLRADRMARIEPGFLVRDAPLALATATGERDLLRLLDLFVRLRTEDGTLDALRRPYFVSPPPAEARRP